MILTMQNARSIDGVELAARIRQWGRELGFDAIGFADTALDAAEAELAAWLEAGFHGEMDYMASHGTKRSRPADYDLLGAGIPAMIVSRSTGDHRTVSTTPAILAEEAKISLDWLDLALYGTPEAAKTLQSETVCTGCQTGIWKLKSKNLASLQR